MTAFQEAYCAYYLKVHKKKWDGSILEKEFMTDFNRSFKQLIDKDMSLQKGVKVDFGSEKLKRMFTNEIIDLDNYDPKFYEENEILKMWLADRAAYLYTLECPVYKFLNMILRTKQYESNPWLFPLSNLIISGLTAYYDASKLVKTGCCSKHVRTYRGV